MARTLVLHQFALFLEHIFSEKNMLDVFLNNKKYLYIIHDISLKW